METWLGAWGAGLGAAIAIAPRRECAEIPPAHRDAAGRCGSAIRGGAWRGSLAGAGQAFLISPILAAPVIVLARPAKPANLDHIMGLFTAGGAIIGAPLGALRAAGECHRS